MAGSVKICLDDEIFNGKDFDFWLYKCCHEKCLSNKVYETGARVYYSLHLITGGAGYLAIGNKKISLKKGDRFIIYPYKDWKYYPDAHNPWTYIWADFSGTNIETLLNMSGFSEETPYLCMPNSKCHSLFLQLLNTYSSSTGSLFECNLIFLNIIANLIEQFRTPEKKTGNGYISPKFIVREAMIFINCNYKLNLTLSDIAQSIGISNSHLVNLFAREANISPMKYLTLYRIASACELLAKKDKNISEVSAEVGFNDPLYFSRCFSEIKGMSPRDYQKTPDGDPWEFWKKSNIDYR